MRSILFLCLMSQKRCPNVQAESSGLCCIGSQRLSEKVVDVHGRKTPVKVKVPQVQFMLSVQDRDQLTPFQLAQLVVGSYLVLKVIRVCGTPADLLCCACRLKAAQGSKTITSLLALNCQRRILLTGTPVQNNLDEFFGKLGVIKTYKLTAALLLTCVHARLRADCHI